MPLSGGRDPLWEFRPPYGPCMDAQKRQKSLSKKRLTAVHNVPTDIHLGERHEPLASLNLLFATNTKRYATGFIVPYHGLVAPTATLVFMWVPNLYSQ